MVALTETDLLILSIPSTRMDSHLKIVCLCPTYGRPHLARNALACFAAQDYPVTHRKILVMDDGNQFITRYGHLDGCYVQTRTVKFHSLTAKYNHMLKHVAERWPDTDVIAIWDDDDIYLPWHLSSLANVLMEKPEYHAAKPSYILSLYQTRHPFPESAAGRFHGSIAVRFSHLQKIGGYPETRRVDFDQQQLRRCAPFANSYEPSQPPSYIYRWQSTGAWHASGASTGPDDVDWYNKAPIDKSVFCVSPTPQFDLETERIYKSFNIHGTSHISCDHSSNRQ